MILGESKLQFLLTILNKWVRTEKNSIRVAYLLASLSQ